MAFFLMLFKFIMQVIKYPKQFAITRPYIFMFVFIISPMLKIVFITNPIPRDVATVELLLSACNIAFVILTKHKKNISKTENFKRFVATNSIWASKYG